MLNSFTAGLDSYLEKNKNNNVIAVQGRWYMHTDNPRDCWEDDLSTQHPQTTASFPSYRVRIRNFQFSLSSQIIHLN